LIYKQSSVNYIKANMVVTARNKSKGLPASNAELVKADKGINGYGASEGGIDSGDEVTTDVCVGVIVLGVTEDDATGAKVIGALVIASVTGAEVTGASVLILGEMVATGAAVTGAEVVG
jgi:hypothetical protein